MAQQKKENREPITGDQLAALRAEQNRTNVRSKSFTAYFSDLPDRLTTGMLATWVSGKVTTAPIGYVEAVLEKYRTLPDAPSGPQRPLRSHCIFITDDMHAALEHEFERTGMAMNRLVKRRPSDAPKISVTKIATWRKQQVHNANEKEWHYVMDTLRRLPDKAT